VDPTNQRYLDYFKRRNDKETREQLRPSTLFDNSREYDEHALDLHCQCPGLYESLCSCRRNSRRCTSLCECTAKIHYRPQDCGNLRTKGSHLREPTNDCRLLSAGEIDHRGMRFTWREPPLRFLGRYRETHEGAHIKDFVILGMTFKQRIAALNEINMEVSFNAEKRFVYVRRFPLWDPLGPV